MPPHPFQQLRVMINTKIKTYAVGEAFGHMLARSRRDIKGLTDEDEEFQYSAVAEYCIELLEVLQEKRSTTRLEILTALMDLLERVVDDTIHDIR